MVNLYMRLGSFLGGASEAPPHGSLNIFEPMADRVKDVSCLDSNYEIHGRSSVVVEAPLT